MAEYPHCTVCQAPVSLRATTCAVCDAPAPPSAQQIPSGEFRSGEWVRFHKPPPELRDVYAELTHALAPGIRLLGMVGEGGMALVFVGRDATLKREVAVKMLLPMLADDEVARTRFRREAEAIAAITNPNIVNVYHVGELPGRNLPYFVMQFVDGPTLGMGALRGRMLTEARVRRLMSDVAGGLAAAHRRKVFHRDIKPGNIMLDGETGRAMVVDFGISAASSRRRSLDPRLTEEGMYLGTPTYMSPEQGAGEVVTGKSDVYSLGVVAFELLAGRPPFEGTPVAMMAAHMNEVPPRLDDLRSDLSDEMATLVARCLEKHPARRPSAEEIVHFLNPVGRRTVEWPPPGMSRVRSAGSRLLGAMAASAASVAIFFGAIGVWPDVAVVHRAGGTPLGRLLVLGVGLALIFGFGAFLLVAGLGALERCRWARGAGYPVWVIVDVLDDTRRDTGRLINGSAEFAFVNGPLRRRFLVLRRARLACLFLAAMVGAAGITTWVIAWLQDAGARPEHAMAARGALALLGCYAAYVLVGVPEWRMRRAERHRDPSRRSGENAPPVRGELVQMWMASAERARRSLAGDPARKR